MESVDLQACLGFLQAIHYSAKVANVNKDMCQSLSCVVGRVRPCLEEVDMAEHDSVEQHSSELRLIATSLQSIHVAITRFSTMGFLQSVLEAQAMCENFSKGRDTLIEALENLATSRATSSTKDWKEEIERLCQNLKGLRFEDCDHLRVAKRVHATARKIIDGDMSHRSGQVIIRSQLLADSNISSKAMQEEIQGLERELSRARVEKQQHEVEELHTIILALKQSTSDAEQDSRPQPPVEYLCPISHRIMRDPVVLVETGQTYDRRYIEEWFNRGNRTCPATKQSVTELHLTPNYALKSLASSWLDVNSTGEDEEDVDSIQFHRSHDSTAGGDSKKTSTMDEAQKLPETCFDADGSELTVECGYAAMEMPHVSQAFKSTPSSVDSSSLIAKDVERNSGDSRDSYVGRNQLFSASQGDLKQRSTKTADDVDAQKPSMQAANVVVNPLASAAAGNTNINYGCVRPEGGKMGVPALPLNSLVSKLPRAARAHGKCMEIMETRSTDHCDASTPRSGYSELPKRMNSRDNLGLNDAMQTLLQARRLKFEVQEEQTPRSNRSASKLLFRADGKAAQTKCGLPNSIRQRATNHGPPSVCSATSRASRDREVEMRQYDELEKVDNGSDAGTDQQPTDEAEEDWNDNPDFDVASLTTIGSYCPKYASSVVSMRPAAKKGSNFCSGFMQGATNVLFGENEDDIDDGNASAMEEEDANDVSLPVVANLLKTADVNLAASLASDLAVKAQTDAAVLQDIPRMDIVPSLVTMLESSSNAAISASARALGVIGERSPEAKMQILNCGAIPILSRLNKLHEEEEMDCPKDEEGYLEDVGNATRFALSALSMNSKQAPSIDVSPQMLVELLASPDEDMQASAVLELLEKCKSAGAEMVLKELTQSDVLLGLVDMLEHPDDDVQFAAAEILSLMIYSDQKTQRELSQSIGIVSKLLRLIKQGGPDCISCKAAATQVIRGLAHNNSKIREDVLKRGVIPEFASLLCCNDPQTRETAAWMLGIMASHSKNGQNEVANCDQAMFVLDELATSGLAQEKVAAKFAMRALGGEVGCEDDDEELLSTPIVIQSLQAGTKEVKIAAAWELCRLANSNQWSQVEIYECGGVTALLAYLKARPGLDGIQACLSTLVKLAGAEARIAAQISQEGGVLIAVRLLKSPAVPDKKLVVQLLTILAEKCPIHQQELVSNGAVPVLVDLLFSEEVICKAACEALSCLIENDMSVISTSVTELATPILLDVVANEESPSFSKISAIQLLGKMGEATFDCQQIVVQQGGVEVLMQIMQDGDDPQVMIATTKAIKSLSKKAPRDQGTGHMHRLVQILETSAAHRRPNATGLVRMNEYVPKSPLTTTTSGNYGSSNSVSLPDQLVRTHSRKPSIAPPAVLPVVPESTGEDSEVDDTDDTQSATIRAPESPVSHTTYEPTPKHTPFNICDNDAFWDEREPTPEESSEHCKIKCQPAPPSVASSSGAKRPPSARSGQNNEPPRKTVPVPARKKDLSQLNNIVENIRKSDECHLPTRTSAAIGELRNLASANRTMGSHLLKTGAVGMLVDRLRMHSCR